MPGIDRRTSGWESISVTEGRRFNSATEAAVLAGSAALSAPDIAVPGNVEPAGGASKAAILYIPEDQ